MPRRKDAIEEVLESVSGKYEFWLDVVTEDDERSSTFLPGSETWRYRDGGWTLQQLREKIGGDAGYMTAPDGSRHNVSLREYQEARFDRARFYPRFRFVPDDPSEMKAAFKRITNLPPPR